MKAIIALTRIYEIELDKCPGDDITEKFKTLASSILLKFENCNKYHFYDIDRSWIIDAILAFTEMYMYEIESYHKKSNLFINTINKDLIK